MIYKSLKTNIIDKIISYLLIYLFLNTLLLQLQKNQNIFIINFIKKFSYFLQLIYLF